MWCSYHLWRNSIENHSCSYLWNILYGDVWPMFQNGRWCCHGYQTITWQPAWIFHTRSKLWENTDTSPQNLNPAIHHRITPQNHWAKGVVTLGKLLWVIIEVPLTNVLGSIFEHQMFSLNHPPNALTQRQQKYRISVGFYFIVGMPLS